MACQEVGHRALQASRKACTLVGTGTYPPIAHCVFPPPHNHHNCLYFGCDRNSRGACVCVCTRAEVNSPKHVKTNPPKHTKVKTSVHTCQPCYTHAPGKKILCSWFMEAKRLGTTALNTGDLVLILHYCIIQQLKSQNTAMVLINYGITDSIDVKYSAFQLQPFKAPCDLQHEQHLFFWAHNLSMCVCVYFTR